MEKQKMILWYIQPLMDEKEKNKPQERTISVERSRAKDRESYDNITDEIHDQSRFLAIMEMKWVDIMNSDFQIERRRDYRIGNKKRLLSRKGEVLWYVDEKQELGRWIKLHNNQQKSAELADHTVTTNVEIKRAEIVIRTKASLDTLKGGIDSVVSRDSNTINKIYAEKNLPSLLAMINTKIKELDDERISQRKQGNRTEKKAVKWEIRVLEKLRDDVESTLKKSTEIEKARDLEDYIPRLIQTLWLQNNIELSENVKVLLRNKGISTWWGWSDGGGNWWWNNETDWGSGWSNTWSKKPGWLGTFETHGMFWAVNEWLKAMGMWRETRTKVATLGNLAWNVAKIGTLAYAWWNLASWAFGAIFWSNKPESAKSAAMWAAILAWSYIWGNTIEWLVRGNMWWPKAAAERQSMRKWWRFDRLSGGGSYNTNINSIDYRKLDQHTVSELKLVDRWAVSFLISLGNAGYFIDQNKTAEITASYNALKNSSPNADIIADRESKWRITKTPPANNNTNNNTNNNGNNNTNNNGNNNGNNNNENNSDNTEEIDHDDRAKINPQLAIIEESIIKENNPEKLKRFQSLKGELSQSINTLHSKHPKAQPKLERDGAKFKLTTYGQPTNLLIKTEKGQHSINIANANKGIYRDQPMSSIAEAVRTANLSNRLTNTFTGKAASPEVGSNTPFYFGHTGSLYFADTWWVAGTALRDTSALKDEWFWGDFERNFPTIDSDKSTGRIAGWSTFTRWLNEMNIRHPSRKVKTSWSNNIVDPDTKPEISETSELTPEKLKLTQDILGGFQVKELCDIIWFSSTDINKQEYILKNIQILKSKLTAQNNIAGLAALDKALASKGKASLENIFTTTLVGSWLTKSVIEYYEANPTTSKLVKEELEKRTSK